METSDEFILHLYPFIHLPGLQLVCLSSISHVFFFKVVLPETCSMLRNVVFPVSAPPNAALQSQAGFFLFCFAIFFFHRAIWVGLPKWLGTPWHSLLCEKRIIAMGFAALHENHGVPGYFQTAGPFCSYSKNQTHLKNSALVGGKAALENFGFFQGSFFIYSKFNSMSMALGRLCSTKYPVLHYYSIFLISTKKAWGFPVALLLSS